MLELAVELGNSHLVQLLLEERAMVHPEGDAVPDTGKMCNCYWMRGQTHGRLHPSSRCVTIHGTGLAFCHAMNLSTRLQVSFVQGSEDAVADLLPNDTQIQQSAGGTAHPSFDDTTDHAKLL